MYSNDRTLARDHFFAHLRNAQPRHLRLIVKHPSAVIATGKHVRLIWQVGTARIRQINTRQPILAGNLLGTQVLLHRYRIVRARLNGRIVGEDHTIHAVHVTDAGDQAGRGHLIRAVHIVAGQRAQLEKCGAFVKQLLDALPGQQAPLCDVPLDGFRIAAALDGCGSGGQFGDERGHFVELILYSFGDKTQTLYDTEHFCINGSGETYHIVLRRGIL